MTLLSPNRKTEPPALVTSEPFIPLTRPQAALRVRAIQQQFARTGGYLLKLLGDRLEAGMHYPADDFRDEATHAHFFYHAHPGEGRQASEHGHFHTFLGREAIPPRIHPFVFPEIALAPLGDSGTEKPNSGPRFPGVYAHLIGLAVDADGTPTSLFTTNRWVTGETWFAAEHVAALLPFFHFEAASQSTTSLVAEWLACVLTVLHLTARELIMERDERIADWRRRRTRRIHVWDDRRLEIVTERRIDFAAELDCAINEGRRPDSR